MFIGDKIHHFLERVEESDEDVLFTAAFLLKAVVSVVGFVVVVILWDTLPSTSPILERNVELKVVEKYGRPSLSVLDEYDVVKLVEFDISRTLVHKETLDRISVPTSRGSYQTGHKSESFEVPMSDALKGVWCLDSTLSWINGLSLRTHKQVLQQHCIEVK